MTKKQAGAVLLLGSYGYFNEDEADEQEPLFVKKKPIFDEFDDPFEDEFDY